MALIKCQECGNEISDKALECPRCGVRLGGEIIPPKTCEECGEILAQDEEVCHKCGCPISAKNQEEISSKKKKVNIKKLGIIAIISVLIAGIAIIFAVKSSRESEDYSAKLIKASALISTGITSAETNGGLIHDVWYNTIFKKDDLITDKYTKKYGEFRDTFNESMVYLYGDTVFQYRMDSVKSNQIEVKKLMKELINPPEEHKEAYNALKDYYNAYLELTNLVTNPSGNLETYTRNFNDATTATTKYYEALKVYTE